VPYQTPANIFTADLLGESNLPQATLDGSTALVAVRQVFAAPSRAGEATLLLRPEELGLAGSAGPNLSCTGRITETCYSGKDQQIVLRTAAFGTMRALIWSSHGVPEIGTGITPHAPAVELYPFNEAVP
jgi:spermidine/putrescine transport system ATP-binding protein